MSFFAVIAKASLLNFQRLSASVRNIAMGDAILLWVALFLARTGKRLAQKTTLAAILPGGRRSAFLQCACLTMRFYCSIAESVVFTRAKRLSDLVRNIAIFDAISFWVSIFLTRHLENVRRDKSDNFGATTEEGGGGRVRARACF